MKKFSLDLSPPKRFLVLLLFYAAELTVSLNVFDILPTVAVRTALPAPCPVTRLGPVAVTNAATVGVSLDQTA